MYRLHWQRWRWKSHRREMRPGHEWYYWLRYWYLILVQNVPRSTPVMQLQKVQECGGDGTSELRWDGDKKAVRCAQEEVTCKWWGRCRKRSALNEYGSNLRWLAINLRKSILCHRLLHLCLDPRRHCTESELVQDSYMPNNDVWDSTLPAGVKLMSTL